MPKLRSKFFNERMSSPPVPPSISKASEVITGSIRKRKTTIANINIPSIKIEISGIRIWERIMFVSIVMFLISVAVLFPR